MLKNQYDRKDDKSSIIKMSQEGEDMVIDNITLNKDTVKDYIRAQEELKKLKDQMRELKKVSDQAVQHILEYMTKQDYEQITIGDVIIERQIKPKVKKPNLAGALEIMEESLSTFVEDTQFRSRILSTVHNHIQGRTETSHTNTIKMSSNKPKKSNN